MKTDTFEKVDYTIFLYETLCAALAHSNSDEMAE